MALSMLRVPEHGPVRGMSGQLQVAIASMSQVGSLIQQLTEDEARGDSLGGPRGLSAVLHYPDSASMLWPAVWRTGEVVHGRNVKHVSTG